jgi:acyl-CoA synthetase (AMP-forming)/AMP-acid ligase II
MDEAVNLGALIEAPAAPDKTALIDLSGGRVRRFSYAALLDEANAIACGLFERGLRRGDRIGILAENCCEFLATFFGALRAGVVAVPVNFKLPARVVGEVLDDAGVALVFCDAERRPLCPEGLPVVEYDNPGAEGLGGFRRPGGFEAVAPDAQEIGFLLYTSGSTGRPKGVPLAHAGQYWAICQYEGLRAAIEAMRAITAAPLFHMNALFFSKLIFAMKGSLVMLPRFRAEEFARAIRDHEVAWVTGVPTMLALIARDEKLGQEIDFSRVELVTIGSAPLSQALIDRIHQLFPRAAVRNGYGTTESGPALFGDHPEGILRPELALGCPLPDCEVRLVDGPNRDEGLLHVKTPALMEGYHRLPEKTAERLRDGWYDTGDVMRRDENGFFYFVGRADDMFVCSGENIYPGEVEKMLESHPAIAQASVVPVPDEIRGAIPVAFLVLSPGAALDEDAVKQYALAEAPPYQHPRHVAFVDALPLAGTNKIDRSALLREAEARFASAP